jgi:hypothetical protein
MPIKPSEAVREMIPLRDLHSHAATKFCDLAWQAVDGSTEQRAFVVAAITAAVNRLNVHINIISGTEPKGATHADLIDAKDDLLVLASALEQVPPSRSWERTRSRLQNIDVYVPDGHDQPFADVLLEVLVPRCAQWGVDTVDRYLSSADAHYAELGGTPV